MGILGESTTERFTMHSPLGPMPDPDPLSLRNSHYRYMKLKGMSDEEIAADYVALEEDLDRLEAMHRDAKQPNTAS